MEMIPDRSSQPLSPLAAEMIASLARFLGVARSDERSGERITEPLSSHFRVRDIRRDDDGRLIVVEHEGSGESDGAAQ
jgi:hypothetical protein